MRKVLGVVVMMILVQTCSGAGKVDHHTVKLHTAFLKDRDQADFSNWRQAWIAADGDKDDLIYVHDAQSVFKDHYNIVHHVPVEAGGRGKAGEIHFMDDGAEFAKMVSDMYGWSGDKLMTYEDFLKALHQYVDIMHKERGALYHMAASIF